MYAMQYFLITHAFVCINKSIKCFFLLNHNNYYLRINKKINNAIEILIKSAIYVKGFMIAFYLMFLIQ